VPDNQCFLQSHLCVSSDRVKRWGHLAEAILRLKKNQMPIMQATRKITMLALAAALFASCSKESKTSLVPKTVDQDASLPSITVNGAKLHSEAYGHPDSTMIVVLHGGPGSDYRVMLNCRELADHGYRVVFYDQRGSGLSQRFPKSYYTSLGMGAVDLMYNDLSGVIAHYRRHPQQKVVLLGHSWGGILATGYAARYPDAVQKLIVAEPGGYKWDEIVEITKKSNSFGLWSESLNNATYIDQFMSGKEDQHELLDYKLAMMGSENKITGEDFAAPGSFWRCGAVINAALVEIGKEHKPDFSAGIERYAKSVLFMYSSQNKAYSDDWAHKLSGVFPARKLVKIDGVGHDGIFSSHSAWAGQTMPQILSHIHSL
jgi:proline iminopeptidase